MSGDHWLEPELEALLEAERSAHVSTDQLERVWKRMARSGGPGGNEEPDPNARGGLERWFQSHAGTFVVVAFVAGGVVGAGVHALAGKQPAEGRPVPALNPIAYVATSLPAAAEPRAIAPGSTPPEPAPTPVRILPPVLPAAPRTAATTAPASSLSAERALLDAARAALEQQDPSRAFALAEEHTSRFPHGQLGEEREALAIQALVLEGRYDTARARAQRLRAAYPNSLFMPAVDATLSSIP